MRSTIFITLFVLLLNTVSTSGQTGYMAGTGQAGIEPYESLISLHLGGYGAPRDGRFTLQWKHEAETPDATAMTTYLNKIYIVSGNDLLCSVRHESGVVWKPIGKAENIISIATDNNSIYALNGNGDILKTKIPGKPKWKKEGTADKSAKVITIAADKLVVTDGKGTLWSASISEKPYNWDKTDMVPNTISLASDNGILYALTADGVIYKQDMTVKERRWLKIAYKNNETIKEDIKLISFLNDRICSISKDNNFYTGEQRSEGNLTARALAIKEGEQTVVIVNVDICGLAGDFTGMLKKEIYEKHHLPGSAVFINSSHTHFAPVAQNWLTWQEANQRPDSVFLYTILKNGILSAVDRALASMAPAELWLGRGSTDIGYNRSLKDHQELYDNAVDVLRIVYTGKNSESYLFMAACHPVFSTAGKLHYTISANYPGVARKLVEDRTGTSNSLFLQGTAGDINPRDNGEYITGEKLSNEVISVLSKPMTKITGAISCFLDTINIPITPWTKAEISEFRAANIDKPGDVYAEKNVKWCNLMDQYYKEGTMPSSLPEYVHTVNIGNWKLVGFSRETTTGYSFGVKSMWPDKIVSVAGYTNDVSSYLPTHMHIEAKGYEGLDSFFWYGMPNVFPVNVDEIILNQIKLLHR